LDLLGGEEVPELSFFPGMELGAERKSRLFERVLRILTHNFHVVDMETHARSLLQASGLKARQLNLDY
jgi:acetolactate synthase regulatory subunit